MVAIIIIGMQLLHDDNISDYADYYVIISAVCRLDLIICFWRACQYYLIQP